MPLYAVSPTRSDVQFHDVVGGPLLTAMKALTRPPSGSPACGLPTSSCVASGVMHSAFPNASP